MIAYDAFVNIAAGRILNYLPQEDYKGATVERISTVKNNGEKLNGIFVRKAGSDIAPTMYMEEYYNEYRDGKPLEDVLKAVAENYAAVDRMPPDVERAKVTDWEVAKDHIFPRLVGTEHNGEYLKDKVYLPASDLAEMFQIRALTLPDGTFGFIPVTENIQRMLGVSTDEIAEAALTNMRVQEPASLRSLNEVMERILGMPVPEPAAGLYVLTNQSGVNGASVILDPAVARAAKETIGDYYILPSSVHEVLLIPKGDLEIENLEEMVMEVNETTVDLQEQLSDHVYEVDPENFSLIRAMGKEQTEKLEVSGPQEEDRDQEQDFPDPDMQKEKPDAPKPKGMSL